MAEKKHNNIQNNQKDKARKSPTDKAVFQTSLANMPILPYELLDKMPVACLFLRVENLEIVEANTLAARLYGYSEKELQGIKLKHLSPDFDTLQEQLRAQAKTIVARQQKKDNSTFVCQIKVSDFSESGFLLLLVEKTEEPCVTTQFQEIFDSHSAIMYLVEAETLRILKPNRAARNFYGYSPEEWENMKITDLNLLPKKELLQKMEQARQKDLPFYEFQHKLANGRVRDIEIRSSEMKTADGKPLFFAVVNDISQRKKAEQRLKESEEKYRLIVENQNEPVIKLDTELNLLFTSTSFCKAFDMTEEELAQKQFLLLVHPAERNTVEKKLKGLSPEKPACYFEHRALTQNGWQYLGWSAKLIQGRNTQNEIVAVGRDITQIKEAEEKITHSNKELEGQIQQRTMDLWRSNLVLQKEVQRRLKTEIELRMSKEKMTAQYKNMPIPTYTWERRQGQICLADYNIAARDFSDRQQAESLIGMPIEVFYAENLQIKDEIVECMNTRRTFKRQQPYKYQTAGQMKFLEITYVYVAPNLVMIHKEDITEQKQYNEKIQQSESRLRAIFDNSLQAFVLIGTDLKIQVFNKAAEEICAMVSGKKFRIGALAEEFIPQENKESLRKHLTQSLKGENIRIETKIRLFNDSQYWFEFQYAPVRNGDKISGIFFSALDINQRKQAEEDVKRTLEQQRELNQLKNRFITTVSHEFRIPLSGIFSNAQLLQRYHTRWDEKRKEKVFGRILRSTTYLKSILDDVSVIGKDEKGLLGFKPQSVEIAALCHDVIEKMQTAYGEKNPIRLKIQDCLKELRIDPALFRHITLNLLSNAVKYSHQPTPVDFKVWCNDQNELLISIEDQGIGIPEKDKKYVFEPFQRAENVENIEGTGLGMSIVSRCVSLHKGKIHLESTEGKGTQARVRLPIAKKTTV